MADGTAAPAAPAAPASRSAPVGGIAPAPETSGSPAVLDWRAALPDDLRADPSLSSFKGIADLAKSYRDTKKLVGDSIRPPKEGAPQQEWDAYYTKLGRPASPEHYSVKAPEIEGFTLSPERQAKALAKLHAAGFTPKQVQAAFDAYGEDLAEAMNAHSQNTAQARERGMEALRKAWGVGGYERGVKLARQATYKFASGDQEMIEYLEDEKGNDPRMLRFLKNIGEAMLEDGEITGDVPDMPTKQTALDKINQIKAARIADPNHPLNNTNNPANAQAQAELDGLYEIAYGTDTVARVGQ